MLELDKVNDVARKAASAVLTQRVDVLSEPTSDSEGQEALQVTIVLERGGADRVSGDMALDTLVEVERALRDAGEDRFPILAFATLDDLETSGESES